MKSLKLFTAFFAFASLTAVNAQDDTGTDNHKLTLNVSQVALLDLYSAESTDNTVAMDVSAINTEAGLYSFDTATNSDLWLNYTSIVSGSQTRNISVTMESTSWPTGLDLKITSTNKKFVANGGGPSTFTAVTLTNDATTSKTLVTGIKNAYTGNDDKGYNLTYKLVKGSNFDFATVGAIEGGYEATITYTISEGLDTVTVSE